MLPDSEFVRIPRSELIEIARQDGFENVAKTLETGKSKFIMAAWSEEGIEVR